MRAPALDVLIGRKARDDDQWAVLALIHIGQGVGQGSGGGGIMAAIEPELGIMAAGNFAERAARDVLQTGRPGGVGDAVGDTFLRPLQDSGAGGGGPGIVDLVRADQARTGQVPDPAFIFIGQAAMLLIGPEILTPDIGQCANPSRFLEQGGFGLGALAPDNGRDTEFADARLLACDRPDVMAEEFLVIEPDCGDDAQDGFGDHIGRIEAATEPDLEDQQIGRVFAEQ